MNHVIETAQLTYSYGKKHALHNISVNILENQMIGLIGRNGTGKTTFMKLCAGLLKPENGMIKVFGHMPADHISIRKEIIYSYTNAPHKASLRLGDIFEYFGMFYEHFDKDFAFKLLDFFSLSRFAKYSSLSQGMSGVFSFICAISTRAKLTLLDEPVIGMDIAVRHKVYEVLLRDYMENPRTIIISSHILYELQDLLSDMIIIDHGEIILYQSMDELQTMSYRVEGSKEAVTAFSKNHSILYEEHKITGSFAILEEALDETIKKDCLLRNLTLSRVTPEELYIYKTNHGKETDFECLWEKQC